METKSLTYKKYSKRTFRYTTKSSQKCMSEFKGDFDGLPTRIVNALRRANINTVSQLKKAVRQGKLELIKGGRGHVAHYLYSGIPGIGKSAVPVIEHWLLQKDNKLKQR